MYLTRVRWASQSSECTVRQKRQEEMQTVSAKTSLAIPVRACGHIILKSFDRVSATLQRELSGVWMSTRQPNKGAQITYYHENGPRLRQLTTCPSTTSNPAY